MQKTRDHPNSRSGYVKEDVLKAISGFFIILTFIAVISLFAGMGGSSGGTSNSGSTTEKIIFVVNDMLFEVPEDTTWEEFISNESLNTLGFTIVDDNVYLGDSKVIESETNLPITPDMVIDSNIEYKDENFVDSTTQLSAPTISIDGSTLTVIDTSGVATNYNVYSNGTCIIGTADTLSTIDLADLITESGTYSITVTAIADGYEESEPSNTVEYVVTQQYTLSGTWLLNETLIYPSFVTISSTNNATADFINASLTWKNLSGEIKNSKGFYIKYSSSQGKTLYIKDDTGELSGWHAYAFSSKEWAMDGTMRAITFDGVQTVSKEEYEWVIENGKKQ